MFKTVQKIRVWNELRLRKLSERGDIVQTVMMLPIAIFMLYALINLSSYFGLRAQVMDTARQGARLVALYGGNSTGAVMNNGKDSVKTIVEKQLWDGKKCLLSYCTKKPVVTCSPEITRTAGTLVKCNIKYYYSPIAPVPKGLEGWNGVTGQPMSVTATYVAETGKKG